MVMTGYRPGAYAVGRPTRVSWWERAINPASPLWRVDWLLLGCVLLLCTLGSLLVWSATRTALANAGEDPQSYFHKQLLNIGIGLALAVLAVVVDYRSLRVYGWVVYGIAILGLVLVLTPLGSTVNGSHSWIELGGGFSFQPSEFAKLGILLAMAITLAERRDREEAPRTGDILGMLSLAALPMGLVMLQPDLGTTMVMAFIVLGVLTVSGAPARWPLGLIAAGVVAGFVVVRLGLLSEYQMNRFAAFADPSLDPRGVGYNTIQSRIAIGAGGLTGKGLFHGSQTTGQFVPEQQTDFIFTVAGEELGFVGAGLIIVLFIVLIWRACRIALRSDDLFGALIAAGVVSWFGFQVFENIGMTIGIMPVTGIPLPYVSYGGSAMFANLIAAGLLLNIQLRSE